MTGTDFYQVLGVARDASADELRKSYKRLAMKYHPDRNKEPEAEQKFKQIQQAYAVLSDEKKRSMYDRFGTADESAFAGSHGSNFSGGFSDIFDSIFGNFAEAAGHETRRPSRRRGRDIQIELKLTLEQAASGVKRQARVKAYEVCTACNGSGAEPGTKPITCPSCGGAGFIEQKVAFMVMQQVCARCGGSGTVIEKPCKACRGTGRVHKSRNIDINVPAGIDSDDLLRIRGQGEAGANQAEPGDLLVRISIERHPFFQREGDNLYCNVPISFYAAAAGGKMKIPLLDNSSKEISIPQGVQSGHTIRIRSAGIKGVRSSSPGDLLCTVNVETPQNLETKQLELLRAFEDSLNDTNAPARDSSWLEKVKSLFS
ncbi:MAG: molecular chaperone DnaJ [Betaproteobacteria bacterium]|nr:molecular chaperone DnaJ [Betaproteobacteria bacterium]